MKLSSVFLSLYGFLFLSLDVAGIRYGPQAINLKLIDRQTRRKDLQPVPFIVQDSQLDEPTVIQDSPNEFPEQWFTQPLDHFSSDSPTFGQRFWVNKRHYVPGKNAPVIVIDGGETSGEDRLPFLDTGIADIIAKATGGIGVILEHRCVRVIYHIRRCIAASYPSDHPSSGTMVSSCLYPRVVGCQTFPSR